MARNRVIRSPVHRSVAARVARKRGARPDDKLRRAFFGLEIETKLARVAELMSGPEPTTKTKTMLTVAADHPKCAFRTLRKWVAEKPQRGHAQAAKGHSRVTYKALEKELLEKTLPLMRDRRQIYTSTMLADDAKDIAARLAKEGHEVYKKFTASAGWLRSFRDRNNIGPDQRLSMHQRNV
eukprot:TRINITY_DN1778_c0_g1_i1.p1 TRINITY_DN1778_c0_g1~~TRINITY_DN1778_c0_g1_i1.p1  ORF type:complete len:181 (+),score=26.54 TRINITY_DN1778_c0_g1_i1:211-753(+)